MHNIYIFMNVCTNIYINIRLYIIITGSDGKQSQFLVKGGEDLRNDERIELLFDLMNQVVSTSTSSTTLNEDNLTLSSDNLRARTYSVIPMTSKMGIMEWVSNTETLKAVVSGIHIYIYIYIYIYMYTYKYMYT
jgi:phosphatidylinositol kinase/protein kinase (PI-3  family)